MPWRGCKGGVMFETCCFKFQKPELIITSSKLETFWKHHRNFPTLWITPVMILSISRCDGDHDLAHRFEDFI
jgi:hypothetical protein